MTLSPEQVPSDALSTDPLPGPFATPPGAEMQTSPEVRALAAGQVRALLESSPAFHQLPNTSRDIMRQDLEKISAYAATLIHDDWHQSQRLGQTLVVREQKVIKGTAEPTPPNGKRKPSAGGRAPEPVSFPA